MYAEPGLRTIPPGSWSFWYSVLRIALGGLSVALAVDNAWAGDDVVFANDGWRIAFGAVGASVALLGLRGFLRYLRSYTREVTGESLRRARLYGGVVSLIGLWYSIASWSDGAMRLGLGLDWWAGPVYGIGGAALMLEGLMCQLDPSRYLRVLRVTQGEGRIVTATVLRAADLGGGIGDEANVRVEMTLDVDGRIEHHSRKAVLDRGVLARIEGATVDVVVDRADPRVWHVEWDTLQEKAGTDR